MAVRTPCGKTFPGNFSIIPSAKKWVVFHAIYCLAFLLCGDEVCSMNYLVLTDKEDAEYRLFESLIATNDKYKYSKVMLCIFHAIWQPFKRDIHPLCPRKSKRENLQNCQKLVVLGVSIVCELFLISLSVQHFLSYIQCLLYILSYLYILCIPIPSLRLSNTCPL